MYLKIVTVDVEISDQYGTSETCIVGVFDNDEALNRAVTIASQRYLTKRTTFKSTLVETNVLAREK